MSLLLALFQTCECFVRPLSVPTAAWRVGKSRRYMTSHKMYIFNGTRGFSTREDKTTGLQLKTVVTVGATSATQTNVLNARECFDEHSTIPPGKPTTSDRETLGARLPYVHVRPPPRHERQAVARPDNIKLHQGQWDQSGLHSVFATHVPCCYW